MPLTPAHVAQFNRDGYLVVPDLLTPAEVTALQQETEDYHETLIGSVPPDVDVTWEPNTAPPRIQQILNAERLSATLDRIIRSDALKTAVSPLLGPDVGLFHVKFIMKSPSVGGPVPWHQDFAYWTDDADAPLQLNCMVYLDDADERNGCLQVIPGSHRGGFTHHENHSGVTKGSFVHEINEPARPEIVSLPARSGTGILFGPLLKHASPPNRSSKPRRTFTAVYSAAGTGHPLREMYWSQPHDVSSLSRAAKNCPTFTGDGPHAGQCRRAYHRRELWKLATARARETAGSWIEVMMSPSAGESLEWFAARRPLDQPLVRFDSYLAEDVTSPGLTIVRPSGLTGPTADDVRSHVNGRVALLHVEGGVYATLASSLAAFAPVIDRGAVLLIDRFFDDAGALHESADALHDATRAHAWRVEILACAGTSAAVVVREVGTAPAIAAAADTAWVPTVSGIQLARGGDNRGESSQPADVPVHAAESTLRKARRAAGMVKRAVGVIDEWEAFFPTIRIPRVTGDGPRRGLCATHARRRELWRYATQLVDSPRLPWCEFGVGEGESLDWFLLHKPAGASMIGFDTFEGIPEPWLGNPVGYWKATPYDARRGDLRIVRGDFAQSLRNPDVRSVLAGGIGLVHIDCDLYSSTQTVLEGLDEYLRPGTVLIFDEFHGFGGFREHEAGAFKAFVESRRMDIEYVALADFQVAVRVGDRGTRASVRVHPLTYTASTPGIYIERGASTRDQLKAALACIRS